MTTQRTESQIRQDIQSAQDRGDEERMFALIEELEQQRPPSPTPPTETTPPNEPTEPTTDAATRVKEANERARKRKEEHEERERRQRTAPVTPAQLTIPVPTVEDLMKGGASKEQAERILNSLPASPTPEQVGEAVKKAETARVARQNERRAFFTTHVETKTGEFIPKAEFDKLSKADQDSLIKLGTVGFTKQQEEKRRQFLATHLETKTGEFIPKAEFDKLSSADRELLIKLGTAGFTKQQEEKRRQFLATHLETKTGEFIPKAEFDKLSSADRELLIKLGTAGFTKQQEEKRRQFLATHLETQTGEFIPKAEFDKLSPEDRESLIKGGSQLFAAKQGVKESERQAALLRLDSFQDGGKFDLVAVLQSGKSTDKELRYLGFDKDDIGIAAAVVATTVPVVRRKDDRGSAAALPSAVAVPRPIKDVRRDVQGFQSAVDRYSQALQEVLPSLRERDKRIIAGRRNDFEGWQGNRPEVVTLLQGRVDSINRRILEASQKAPTTHGTAAAGATVPKVLKRDLAAAQGALQIARYHNADTRLSSETDAGAAVDAISAVLPIRAPMAILGFAGRGTTRVVVQPVTRVVSKLGSRAAAAQTEQASRVGIERLAAARPGRIPRVGEVVVHEGDALVSAGKSVPFPAEYAAAARGARDVLKAVFLPKAPSLEGRLVKAVLVTRNGLRAGTSKVLDPAVRAFGEERLIGQAMRNLSARGFSQNDLAIAQITLKDFVAANRDLPLKFVRKDVDFATKFLPRQFAIKPLIPRGGSADTWRTALLRGDIPPSILRAVASPAAVRLPVPGLKPAGRRPPQLGKAKAPIVARLASVTVRDPVPVLAPTPVAPPAVAPPWVTPRKSPARLPVMPSKPREIPQVVVTPEPKPGQTDPSTEDPKKDAPKVDVPVQKPVPPPVDKPKITPTPTPELTLIPTPELTLLPVPNPVPTYPVPKLGGGKKLRIPIPLVPLGKGKTAANGGSDATVFELPSGVSLPRGVFPLKAQWVQGKSIVTFNFLTGAAHFSANKGKATVDPNETFRVLSTTKTPPKRTRLPLGIVSVQVTRRGLFFHRAQGNGPRRLRSSQRIRRA